MLALKQSAFAAERGVSRKTVTQWKKQGLIVFSSAGLVDVSATVAKIDARPQSYRGGKRTTSPPVVKPLPDKAASISEKPAAKAETAIGTQAEAVAKKEHFLALLREIDYERESGAVIEIDDATDVLVSELSRVRSKILAIPSKVAGRLAVLKSANEVKAFLDAEIRLVLEDLTIDSGDLARLAKKRPRRKSS